MAHLPTTKDPHVSYFELYKPPLSPFYYTHYPLLSFLLFFSTTELPNKLDTTTKMSEEGRFICKRPRLEHSYTLSFSTTFHIEDFRNVEHLLICAQKELAALEKKYKRDIMIFPLELRYLIFKELHWKDLLYCASVNREWRECILDFMIANSKKFYINSNFELPAEVAQFQQIFTDPKWRQIFIFTFSWKSAKLLNRKAFMPEGQVIFNNKLIHVSFAELFTEKKQLKPLFVNGAETLYIEYSSIKDLYFTGDTSRLKCLIFARNLVPTENKKQVFDFRRCSALTMIFFVECRSQTTVLLPEQNPMIFSINSDIQNAKTLGLSEAKSHLNKIPSEAASLNLQKRFNYFK